MRVATRISNVVIVLTLLVPTTGAGVDEDGHLSRTFLTLGSINWEPHSDNPNDGIGGAGWYHPDSRDDLCFARLFGFSVAAGIYYETARIASSAPGITMVTLPGTTVSGDPCPFDSTLPSGQVIGTSEATINVGFEVSQSALLCTKTFSLCNPDTATASWILYDCGGVTGVRFGVGDIVGVSTIPAPISYSPTLGSSQLISGCANKSVDVSDNLDGQLNNLASLHDVPISNVASGTTYVLSCFSIEYDVFPANERRTGVSHDWFLAVDGSVFLGDAIHFLSYPGGAASSKYTTPPNSVALQGWYDLSGNNGCDAPGSAPSFEDNPPLCMEIGKRVPNQNKFDIDRFPCPNVTNCSNVISEWAVAGYVIGIEGARLEGMVVCKIYGIEYFRVSTAGGGQTTIHAPPEGCKVYFTAVPATCSAIGTIIPPPSTIAGPFICTAEEKNPEVDLYIVICEDPGTPTSHKEINEVLKEYGLEGLP